jgi:hypothetical protein
MVVARPGGFGGRLGEPIVRTAVLHPDACQLGSSASSHLAGLCRDDLQLRSRTLSLFWAARLRVGGEMLFKTALVLLAAWLLGVLGLYSLGDLVHVLLLVGLMLLLLAFLRARDAAVRRAIGNPTDTP